MAIELNNRTKIFAGVVVLLAAGAGAWFFFLQDFLNEPPPAPKAAVATPAKPAADAPKSADAPKAADAGKTADAGKAADAGKGDAPKAADAAPKPAAQAAAKPIPTNPDQLIAEVIQLSGLAQTYQALGGEVARQAAAGGDNSPLGVEGTRALADAMQRQFDPAKMNAETAAALKTGLDAERMGRYLEILRQPLMLRVLAEGAKPVVPEEYKAFNDELRKNPPSAARSKLIQSLDSATRSTEFAGELIGAMAREMVDTLLADLAKAGKKVPPGVRNQVASQLNAIRGQVRNQTLAMMQFQARSFSDEDLGAYLKLLDTDTGRWGNEQLLNAARPVLTSRFGNFGREIAKIVQTNRTSSVAKAPAAMEPEPLAKASTEAAAEKPAPAPAAAPLAPPEPVGYRRPANIKPLYSKYNDVITATVMRDRAAVKELLDDGKLANARQADGTTPLMIAVGNGDGDIASLLLAKGADPTLRSQGGNTALSIARSRGNAGAELAQLLQRAGAKE